MSSAAPTLTLRSAGDLVAVLPYLLGYQPRDALVLVCVRNSQICITACQPLTAGGEPPRAFDSLLAGVAKADPEGVIVIGYENTVPVRKTMREAAEACAEVGIRVHDEITVGPDTWQSLDPTTPTGGITESSTAVAELVGAGVAPLPSREALAATLQEGADAKDVERHIARYLVRDNGGDLLDVYCSAWLVVLDTGDEALPLTSKVAARAVLALREVAVRDLVVARLTPGTLAVSDVPGTAGALLRTLPPPPWATDTGWDRIHTMSRLQHRLTRLCAMTPDSYAAPACSVLASWAWWRGDGALARVALERALRCDPGYRLSQLLEQVVDLAIRPPR